MKNYQIVIFLLFLGCGNSQPKNNYPTETPPYNGNTNPNESESKQEEKDVGGTASGTPVFEGVEDDYAADEREEYDGNYGMDNSASARLNELSNAHRRNNGSLKRAKIARILNKEGYRKENGDKFRRKDIPKS